MSKTKQMNKPIGVQELAKKAKVSIASACLVYRNPQRVGEAVRLRVINAAKELGYIPKFLKKRAAYGNIGLLIDKNRAPFGEHYNPIITSILDQAQDLKWQVSIKLFDSNNPDQVFSVIEEQRNDGLLLLGKIEDKYLKLIIEKEIPYCVIDYISENIQHNSIHPDWKQGVQLAMEHLLKHGHKTIGMLYSPLDEGRSSSEKLKAYSTALVNNGLPFTSGLQYAGKYGFEETKLAIKNMLMHIKKPTAFLCATDAMTLAVYQIIKSAGSKIPRDISLVGFNNLETSPYLKPLSQELTSVDVDKKELGLQALNLVQNIILGKTKDIQEIVLPMELNIRNSVGSITK